MVAPLLVGDASCPLVLEAGARWCAVVGDTIVVLRPRVSESDAEGGGGRFARMAEGGMMEARQRKHSPVP